MQVFTPVEGVMTYQRLLFLKELKRKYEPKSENVRTVILNESEPRKKRRNCW